MAITDGLGEALYLLQQKTKEAKSQVEKGESKSASTTIDQVIFGMELLIETLQYGVISEIRLSVHQDNDEKVQRNGENCEVIYSKESK